MSKPVTQTGSALERNEKALENRWAQPINQKLLQDIRDEMEREGRRKALKDSTGITDDAVLDELAALDFDGENIVALALEPLVEVAWADGTVTEPERKDVLSAAVEFGLVEESPGYKLLESWLQSEPCDEFRKAWRYYVRWLQLSPNTKQALKDDILRRARHKAEILGLARHVAAVDGSWIRKVSRAQDAVLKSIEEAFV